MDLFFIKKLLGILLMPINIVLILLFIAIVLFKYHQKLSRGFLILGFMVLLITSTPFISDNFIKPIESQYRTFNKQDATLDYIVILGCGHTTNNKLPALTQLQTCSLQRLIEAFRIFQLHPEATIITSGYGGGDVESNAVKVKDAAISLGIPEAKIITQSSPKDTEEEAILIAPLLINKKFALVTNANHMPRAAQYFINQNTAPIPAPTGYFYKGSNDNFLEELPRSTALNQTSVAWYEKLGQFVQWLKR